MTKPTGSPPVRWIKYLGRTVLQGKRYYCAKRMFREAMCHTGGLRVLPDFLIIGAQKSGSSSLFYYLQQHPHVKLPLNITKEVHYFDQHYYRGLRWYRGHFPLAVTIGLKKHFAQHRLVTGEATPEYIIHPRAPERVATDLPKARCVAVLRNPIDRAFSQYKMEVKRTAEKRSFEDAIALELEHGPMDLASLSDEQMHEWNNGLNIAYLTRGLYGQQIDKWYEYFPRKQILILSANDLYEHTPQTLARVHDFLGIHHVTPKNIQNINRGGYSDSISPKLQQRLNDWFATHDMPFDQIVGQYCEPIEIEHTFDSIASN